MTKDNKSIYSREKLFGLQSQLKFNSNIFIDEWVFYKNLILLKHVKNLFYIILN
jgi:hypothetical protein